MEYNPEIHNRKTLGYRYHMSNINAAIGLAQLKKLEHFISRRREICKQYEAALEGVGWIRCLKIDYETIAPFMYVIRVLDGQRDALMEHLKKLDIETGISYIPSHHLELFKGNGSNLPETEKAFQEILSLPLHFEISDEDVRTVVNGMKSFK